MPFGYKMNAAIEHENRKGQEVQAGKGLREKLVVACEATEACHPGEAAFDDSAAGQEDEAALRSSTCIRGLP